MPQDLIRSLCAARVNHWLAQLLVAALLLAAAPLVGAACWHDAELQNLANAISRERFRGEAFPTVVACDDGELAPQFGGDYNRGTDLIRVPMRSRAPGAVWMVLAHEVGHAVAARRGVDDSFGGHGAVWLDVMREAGLDHEARRMAHLYNGLYQLYARRYGEDRPVAGWTPVVPATPVAPTVVCWWVNQWVLVQINRRVYQQLQAVQICNQQ